MDPFTWRCIACGAYFSAHLACCTGCLASGTLLRVGHRPAAEIDGVAEVTDAHALAKAAWTIVESSAFPNLQLGLGALVLVYGEAGHGKSSFAARALDGLGGPVVLASAEEAPGPALHARLARCRIRRPDFVIIGRASVDQVAGCVRDRNAIGLGIDSVQAAAYSPEELRHLLVVLPRLRVLIGVAQVNKRGEIEGRERLRHEADVVVECQRDKISVQGGNKNGDPPVRLPPAAKALGAGRFDHLRASSSKGSVLACADGCPLERADDAQTVSVLGALTPNTAQE